MTNGELLELGIKQSLDRDEYEEIKSEMRSRLRAIRQKKKQLNELQASYAEYVKGKEEALNWLSQSIFGWTKENL